MGKLHSIYIENFNHLFFKYRKLETSRNLNLTNSRSKDVATEFQMEGRDREPFFPNCILFINNYINLVSFSSSYMKGTFPRRNNNH